MSLYGVEITASNGNSFLIPDKNPFTFHHRWDYRFTASDTWRMKTDIPDTLDALFFAHLQMHSSNDHPQGFTYIHTYREGGWWWILASVGLNYGQQTMTIFSFTSKELKDVSGGSKYGMEVFDEKGDLIYGNISKPLKMIIHPGPPPRPVDGFIGTIGMGAKYAVLQSGWAINTHRGSTNIARCYPVTTANGSNLLSGFLTGVGGNMTSPESWIYYNASNVLCIQFDAYQN